MFTYSQREHTMSRDGMLLSTSGHAGNGRGLNNPAMQNVPNVGPLPRGRYKIGSWVIGPRAAPLEHLGPLTVELIPQPDATGSLAWMCGRFGFFIHGPELSEGCIVQLERDRLAMSRSGDNDLTVEE